jgi:hypothetical protein
VPRPKERAHRRGELRAYLLAQEREVFGLLDELFDTASAIERGEPVRVHRCERCLTGMGNATPGIRADLFMLGADDVLRPA